MIPGVELEKYLINGHIDLYVMNVKENSQELLDYIDEYIVSICEGDSESKIINVKKELLEFLNRKKDSTTRMGAVAEFFVHLILNSSSYKQECLFLNLEENSIKKGFDGYYSKNNEEWIMESKSGMSTTMNISHPIKLKEAYDDLKEKLRGNVLNNPWKNAYNHASHIDVKTDKSIRAHIKAMSDDFLNSKYAEIREFNIIPASTIFLDNSWEDVDLKSLIMEISAKVNDFEYKKLNLICITKIAVDILQKMLTESIRGEVNE
ncbi:hypothetical protein FDA95_02715 [Clostridium botulinum]|nr:hypothetical protein [Clostridium botulinum]NFK77529.1 hypothetical protein [Clostridium botulinum]